MRINKEYIKSFDVIISPCTFLHVDRFTSITFIDDFGFS